MVWSEDDYRQECYLEDSCFSLVKTCFEMAKCSFNYVVQVKMPRKNFPKKYLKDTMDFMSPNNWDIMRMIKLVVSLEEF